MSNTKPIYVESGRISDDLIDKIPFDPDSDIIYLDTGQGEYIICSPKDGSDTAIDL